MSDMWWQCGKTPPVVKLSQMLQMKGHLWMVWSSRLLLDGQRVEVALLRLDRKAHV